MVTVTTARVESRIQATEYFYSGLLTICVLTLKNGFKVVGQSACVDPAIYNAETGRFYAYADAQGKVEELEGYLLKEQMYQGSLA